VPTCRTQQSTNGNSSNNDDDDSDDDNDDECNAPANDLGDADTNGLHTDQDEDVIRAAEEAQEGDLDEAAQTAELAVVVTDGEQKTASTALSKVSVALF
jgi:hypothetical protein